MLGDNEYQGWATKILPIVHLEDGGYILDGEFNLLAMNYKARVLTMAIASSLWGSGVQAEIH